MPISHKYKLIFIHIPKCAGVSIWKALDLSISKENLINTDSPILQHLLPSELKQKWIDKRTWNSYKKFTIIRNPYDRVVSDYFWLKEHAPQLITNNFDDFLSLREDVVLNNKYNDNIYYDHFYPMHFYFKDISFDHVIRFENLNKGYQELQKLYNIKNKLSKINYSNRSKFSLNKQQRDRIYKLYEKDFISFQYDRNSYNISEQSNPENRNINSSSMLKLKKNIPTPAKSKIKNELLTSIDDIIVQIFYTQKNLDYSEKLSVKKTLPLNNKPQTFSFELTANKTIFKFIRFDIGAKTGLVNIHDIEIKDNNKNTIFVWDKYTVTHKTDSFLFINEELFGKKVVQLSLSDDPNFSIATNLKVQEQSKKGIIVEVTLSSLEDKQIAIFENRTTPLSYINQEQTIKDKHNAEILAQKVTKLSTTISNLKKTQTDQFQNLNTKKLQIEQLAKDKKLLISEGKRKDELIKKILKINDNLDKLTDTHKEVVKELSQTKENLSKQTVNLEKLTLINTITNEKNDSLKIQLEEASLSNKGLIKEIHESKETLHNLRIELKKLTVVNNLANKTNSSLEIQLKETKIVNENILEKANNKLTVSNKSIDKLELAIAELRKKIVDKENEFYSINNRNQKLVLNQNKTIEKLKDDQKELINKLKNKEQEITILNKKIKEIIQDFIAIIESKSWKITQPLRSLKTIFKAKE